jgi:hypothetical protein
LEVRKRENYNHIERHKGGLPQGLHLEKVALLLDQTNKQIT